MSEELIRKIAADAAQKVLDRLSEQIDDPQDSLLAGLIEEYARQLREGLAKHRSGEL